MKAGMSELAEKVFHTIARHKMVLPGELVLVAVSGGPDSTAMLHALSELADRLGITLAAAHIDHGLRPDSATDARFVEDVAGGMGIEFALAELRLGEALGPGDNVQESAREARYAFLDDTAKKMGADRIAVGHTMDDQAETYIMRQLRGSGAHGLGGIPPVRGSVIRPLIDVSRREVTNYLDETGTGYVTDPTNLKPKYLRNRIRLELMPVLAAYNPDITATLARTADILRDEDAYLDTHAAAVLGGLVVSDTGWAVTLDGRAWGGLHIAQKRRALRILAGKLKGNTRGLGYGHVEDALDMLGAGRTGSGVDLPGGVRVELSYGNPVVYIVDGLPGEFCGRIGIPGRLALPSLGVAVEARRVDKAEMAKGTGKDVAYVNAARLSGPLSVRNRMPGDRFHPAGMDGTVKLKEFFIDMKLPRIARATTPIVTCGEDIVWVAGIRQDGRFSAGPDADGVVELKLLSA